MPDESHHTTTTSPTSQGSAPSAPARTTSRFHKPSVALSWILGIVFFLDIPPVLFWGWCAFVSSENNAPDNPPDCAPISPCSPTPIQRHRDITISQLLTGIVGLCVVLLLWRLPPASSAIRPRSPAPAPSRLASPYFSQSGLPSPSAHLLDRRLRVLCLLHSLRPHLDALARLHHHAGPLLRS